MSLINIPKYTEENEEMFVIKRNGEKEKVQFDKIQSRILNLAYGLKINVSQLTMKVIEQLLNEIHTSRIDELTAEQCTSMASIHTDYNILASRIVISNHHKNVSDDIMNVFEEMEKTNTGDLKIIEFVRQNKDTLNGFLEHSRDLLIDYFGFKTLQRAYLIKTFKGITVERIQHLWMRVAIGVTPSFDLNNIRKTYDLLSQKKYTHATPTLFNSCCKIPQLSSCFLVGMEDDSLDGIYNTLKECALISKWSGGIGLHIHNIRANGTLINGTSGKSTGIVQMLKVFNETAKYVNQGGKRNGSFAIYLEPWHLDIENYLELRKNHGDENSKSRDLFYGLWIPDLFMKRVEKYGKWTLFCPHVFPNLSNVYGEEFEKLYLQYETDAALKNDDYGYKVINAKDLWYQILVSQMETGMPYMLYKDAVNKKSNQSNLGTIKSSNLCCEITEYSDENETAVCNLASVSLPAYCIQQEGQVIFDYNEFSNVVETIVENLDNIIDVNYYPTEKARISNIKNRPIGIGVQGMAEMMFKLNIDFHSEQAVQINTLIFETMYYSALKKSNELAISRGSYTSFIGSPASKGILQYDLWNKTEEVENSSRYNWKELKQNIITNGLRHSLLIAPMPTATTSQIFGNTECFDPIQSNIFTRKTLAGEFIVVNEYLIKDLGDKWNNTIRQQIIANRGSVLNIKEIPQSLQNKYKTIWEISTKHMIGLAIARGPFICQSQSLNLHMEKPTIELLTKAHFYGWRNGLKTGMYYLRRKGVANATQFTVEADKNKYKPTEKTDEEGCTMCSA